MKKPIEYTHPLGSSRDHGRILSIPDRGRFLDSVQLEKIEQSFRIWADASKRPDIKLARKRILLIFLLIRYTGAKLNEILTLDPWKDIDIENRTVVFCKERDKKDPACRVVQIPALLAADIRKALDDLRVPGNDSFFKVDPAHVRRKFYERAEDIGIPRELGAPEFIRRSRAVELMQSNVPLPVVQKILGHSTPNLAASYVEFSDDEIRQVARYFADREDRRKTSARNAFYGKIAKIRRGDVQTIVEVLSISGYRISAAITTHSLARLGLKAGTLVVAEVKAPWVMLYRGDQEPKSTAENIFRGTVSRIISGKITTEIVVRIADGTELCSIITAASKQALAIKENDTLWAAFNAFAVVLHVD
jgi:molybdate transport system regulatory protein